MKHCLLFTLLLLITAGLVAQATTTATASSGGAYSIIESDLFLIEGPDDSSEDCDNGNASDAGNHKAFGDHITQVFDADLGDGGQNVFNFISHIDEDSDRCENFDRVRIEIKGGPAGNTDPELEHEFGDESFYRWQFKLDAGFVGTGSFCHIFQSKAQGGSNTGFPILTLTARANVLELIHAAADDNLTGDADDTAEVLTTASMSALRGNWVEVFMRQVHTDAGELEVTIKDVATGALLLTYSSSNIDLWREASNSATINRPKWGIYRSKRLQSNGQPDPVLRDEEVRFANFCSSESSEAACPSIIIPPDGTPLPVANALPLDASEKVPLYMPLLWEAATDATEYNVYFGTSPTLLPQVGTSTSASFNPTLAANTTYYFQIGAVNAMGEARNDIQSFTTLANPDDGNWDVARGHATPELENAGDFELDTNLDPTVVVPESEVNMIAGESGNNAACFFSGEKDGSNGNYRYRYEDAGSADALTAVLRLSPTDLNSSSNLIFVELNAFGRRMKIRINETDMDFQQAIATTKPAFPAGYWDNDPFHVIRFTYELNGDNNLVTAVYLDESTVAFASAVSSSTSNSSRIEFGRAGSENYGACFDYIAVDNTGAFAPNQGTPMPIDLVGSTAAGDPPAAVTKVLPLDGSSNVPLTMPLVWDSSVGATNYNVYLVDPITGNLIKQGMTSGTTFDLPTVEGANYTYRIGAENSDGETLNEATTFSTLDNGNDGEWAVTRGHAFPEIETDGNYTLKSGSATELVIDEVRMIAGEPGNNAYCFLSDVSGGRYRVRYNNFDDEDEVTAIIRLAKIPETDDITFFEFYGLGWRQKVRINSQSLKFETADPQVEIDFPANFWDGGAFHVFRFTYSLEAGPTTAGTMTTRVYVDEATTPFGTAISDEEKTSQFVEIGRAGSAANGVCIDFVAVNATGAFAPGDGPQSVPPADLGIEAVLPLSWTTPLSARSYGKEQVLTWGVRNQISSDFFTVESSTDGREFLALGRIHADGDLPEERFFNYTDTRRLTNTTYYRIRQNDFDGQYSYSNTVAITPTDYGELPLLAPNPTSGELSIFNLPGSEVSYRIFNIVGAEVTSGVLPASNHALNVARLPTGTYILHTVAEGETSTHRFVKR